jgi:hypothetical protein
MSKDTFYFSHDYNSRHDPKLVSLVMNSGLDALGIYWCLIEMLYEQEGYISIYDINSIAFELHTDCERIKDTLENHRLFEFKDEYFYSESVLRRLKLRNKKSNAAKESALKRWYPDKYKDANALRTESESNAIKESKVKEKKKEEYGFVSPEYLQPFIDWIEYKKARKESYKNEKSIKAFYKKLLRLSENDPKKAILIIEDSMANNYAGLFPLKTNGSEIKKQPIQSITIQNSETYK